MRKIRSALRLAIVSWLACVGCGAPDAPELADGDVATVSQALGQWPVWSGPNFGVFDIGYRFACMKMASLAQIACMPAEGSAGHGQMRFAGYSVANNIVPGGVRSIALGVPSIYDGSTNLYVLGTDSVVRYASGKPAVSLDAWYTGHFKTFYTHLPAKLTSGEAVCIKKIALVRTPSRYASAQRLLGLSCSGGKLYVASGTSGWLNHPEAGAPWSSLAPGAVISDISHGLLGAYLLSNDRVLLIGSGSVDADGTVHYTSKILPVLPDGLKPTAVGGPWVITNSGGGSCAANASSCPGDAKRIYRYDSGTNTWTIPAGLVMPNPDIDIGDPLIVPFTAIVDGYTFRTNANNFFLWHHFSRVYEWLP
jgi:hypothetical protein